MYTYYSFTDAFKTDANGNWVKKKKNEVPYRLLLGNQNKFRDLSGFDFIGNEQLVELSLQNNGISDIPSLAKFPSFLEGLDLSCNFISDIAPFTNSPPFLERLDLSDNKISDISPLAHLPSSLQNLYLHNNQIVDISPLTNLSSSLQELHLESNQIVDISPLTKLPHKLRQLDLEMNQIIDASPVLSQLAYSPNLNIILQGNPGYDRHLVFRMHQDPNRSVNQQLLIVMSATHVPRLSQNSALRNERTLDPIIEFLAGYLKE